MLAQYEGLLAQAVVDRHRPAAGLSLVPPSALALLPDPRQPLSDAWMGAVQERFAAWAGRAPERLAVADPREAWSYGELEERANRLAQRLIQEGVRKGDVVAILGHRSARLAWAVLGTLKAGAAFTILDPAHPPARLVDTLRLAQPRGFIALAAAGAVPAAVEAFLDELRPASRFTLPAADDGGDPTALFPAQPAGVTVGPDDLAYLSFTSGSTGLPKGILGRHGPLSHFLPWQERVFGFGPDDRYSMLSGLAHDPLQRDLFTPFQTGAAVIAPDPADIAVPGRLAAWLRDAGITVAHLTPAMGQILCQLAPGEPAPVCERLRWAFFVGDVLTHRDVALLTELAPDVAVVNYYGSTETQRAVGYHLVAVPAHEPGGSTKQSLPLGRGIEDVQLLVVNPAGRLAGVGELGEILMRSPHLAAGYLGDAEGTAARFTPNPLADAASERIYRTGDLGRYLLDGEVEFAGRADMQVKIRGFRIEPGEVEAWLGRHPAVRDCVVVARDHRASGGKRLVAYVVPRPSVSTNPVELRTYLRERLPDAMVPAAFVILEKLPVNPNGKVDRRALPEPAEEPRAGEFAAPQTDVERTLAGILREVLGVGKLSREDNFFELGGNSLQMVKVHARVKETFGVDLQVVQLFTHPTVATLAAFLVQGEAAPRPAAVVEDRTEQLQTGRNRLRRQGQQRRAGEESK
jgi:amino acid adenylation domain-containing protein